MNPHLSTLTNFSSTVIVLFIISETNGLYFTVGRFIGAVACGLYVGYVAKHANTGIKARYGEFGEFVFGMAVAVGIISFFDLATQKFAILQPGVSLARGFCKDSTQTRVTELGTLLQETKKQVTEVVDLKDKLEAMWSCLKSQPSLPGTEACLNLRYSDGTKAEMCLEK